MKMNRNGYFFDVNTKTLYMTKAFERKALQYGSEEFKLAKELRKMFPDIKTEIKVRPSKAKPLTYKQMEAFIALLPTAQEDLKEMERQRKMSVAYKSPFRYMEKWFEKKYCGLRKARLDGKPIFTPVSFRHKFFDSCLRIHTPHLLVLFYFSVEI